MGNPFRRSKRTRRPFLLLFWSMSVRRCIPFINAISSFGDLWEYNILYDASKSGTVLVDFDWPGEDGVSRYPLRINLSNQWPEVVPYDIPKPMICGNLHG